MRKEIRSAIFVFEENDSWLVNELANYLDKNYLRIYDFFDIDDKFEKPIINIIETKKRVR